jgi:O-succinylbenzoic acid--CoA ligase
MTETITHIALRPLNPSAGKKKSQPIYTGLPGVFFETDSRGCLVIHAGHLSTEAIVTNDLVELASENEFVWKGRLDSVINSGGVKLIPEEIEHKFSECIEGRFFVAGLPDQELGRRLVFVIEGPADNHLLDRLARFQKESGGSILKQELPKELFFLDDFIETESKKIDRLKTLGLLKH